MNIRRYGCFGAFLATVLVCWLPLVALAQSEPEVEERDSATAALERFRDSVKLQLDEARSLDAIAAAATPRDARALQRKAMGLRLAATRSIAEITDRILALESEGQNVEEMRARLEEFLPKAMGHVHTTFDAATALEMELGARIETAISEGAVPGQELRRRAADADATLGRVLAAGAGIAESMEKLGVPAEQEREWLREHVAVRARVLWARIEFLSSQAAHASAQHDKQPDNAELGEFVSRSRARLQASTKELGQIVEIMEDLDLESARYKQALIEYTGRITSDVLDRRVAGQLITRWLKGGQDALVENGPATLFRVLVFIVILTCFWLLARVARRVAERAVEAPNLRLSELLKRMVVSASRGVVLLLGLLVGFSQLGIEVGPMLAGLGIAGFIVGFALQDTLGNFASGIMILLYRPFDVGDLIECSGGVFGTVSYMSLVSTTVLTVDNRTLIVPNAKIWGDVITNVTAQKLRRVDLQIGISYGDDIPSAEEVLIGILEEHPKVLKYPEWVVKVHELGDSSVNFIVRPWAARDDYWDVYWDVTREVKLRFDREGISIPFPQRDIHVISGESAAAPVRSAMEVSSTELSGAGAPDGDG